jgi:hypothetical protein
MKMKIIMAILAVIAFGTGNAFAVNFQVDPRGSFLQRNGDPGATGPLIIDLNALSFFSGSSVTLTSAGAFDPANGSDTYKWMVAVFSTSNVVLSSDVLRRVPGAVASSLPQFVTPPTDVGSRPTDIPEDFYVDVYQTVAIPEGARYLMVGTYDPYSGNNSDPNGDWMIGVSSVPEMSSMSLTILGLAIVGGVIRKRKVTGVSRSSEV